MLRFSSVPCKRKSSVHNLLKNILSLSETIETGKPCNLTTSRTDTSAIEVVLYGCFKPKKWAYLDNLSTITNIELAPFDMGNPSMKSIATSSQTRLEMGRGCNSPACDFEMISAVDTQHTAAHDVPHRDAFQPNTNHQPFLSMF